MYPLFSCDLIFISKCLLACIKFLIFFISLPFIPYSYRVEVLIFVLDLYTICRTAWTSDRPVARALHKHRTTQTQNKRTHTHTANIHALSGTRTHDHSLQTNENSSCLSRSATVTGACIINATKYKDFYFHFKNVFRMQETLYEGLSGCFRGSFELYLTICEIFLMYPV
jgi:hypothetical protein